jgi:hypothetical protein
MLLECGIQPWMVQDFTPNELQRLTTEHKARRRDEGR